MCLPVKPFAVEKEWNHAGFLCTVVLNREQGHRCGYVRVPPSHVDHGKDYNEVDVNIHGGLTFGEIEPCAHEDGTGFWFGFDCAHFNDASFNPNVPSDYAWTSEKARRTHEQILKIDSSFMIHKHYWTLNEVVAETESLAQQFAERSNGN